MTGMNKEQYRNTKIFKMEQNWTYMRCLAWFGGDLAAIWVWVMMGLFDQDPVKTLFIHQHATALQSKLSSIVSLWISSKPEWANSLFNMHEQILAKNTWKIPKHLKNPPKFLVEKPW